METTSVATQSGTQTASFDHQQVAKNKRKKFNPKFMLTNSSSDDEGGGSMANNDDGDQMDDENTSGNEMEKNGSTESQSNEIISDGKSIYNLSNTNFSITKSQNNNNDSPPPAASNAQITNPFLSPSKLSLLQTFGSLQHQQQLLQQAAVAAIAPQFSHQLNPAMSLSETEAKFREFAFKTMQELLNIYGLSLSPNDVVDALKQQNLGELNVNLSNLRPLLPICDTFKHSNTSTVNLNLKFIALIAYRNATFAMHEQFEL